MDTTVILRASDQTSPATCQIDAAAAQGLKLRVMHVLSSLQVGGMEHFVLRIALHQQKAGVHSEILAVRGGPLVSEAREQGLRVHVLDAPHRMGRTAAALFHMVRAQPRIVHVHNESSLHYALLGKRVTRAKLVLTHHGRGHGCHRTPSRAERRLTDAVVAVSQGAARQLTDPDVIKKLTVIHNGVELQRPVRAREQVRADLGLTHQVVGIIVARVDGLKGHDTLLRALALLPRTASVCVIAAGDGSKRSETELLARELGLNSDRFRILGFRPDVPDLLAAADFFVLPSLTEGLPLSVLEAMSHGLPVIATPVGGVPELVQDGVEGELIPVEDAPALAAAIARSAGSPTRRRLLGDAARHHVADNFSMLRMISDYDALYRRLLGGAAGKAHSSS